MVVLGVSAAIVVGGELGAVLALVLISLGLMGATALLFYEVGLSEDRERAREAGARARRRQPVARDRRRLDRMRGRRRELG